MGKLQAETQGKGILTIDLEVCRSCASKVCVGSCPAGLLSLEGGLPKFSKPLEEVRKACNDCLACELECSLKGRGGLKIVYPMPRLEAYLSRLEREGVKTVWRRS